MFGRRPKPDAGSATASGATITAYLSHHRLLKGKARYSRQAARTQRSLEQASTFFRSRSWVSAWPFRLCARAHPNPTRSLVGMWFTSDFAVMMARWFRRAMIPTTSLHIPYAHAEAMPDHNSDLAWVRNDVLEFLRAEAVRKAPLETGGVLMGYFAQPGNVPVILWATGPGSRALHLRNYYGPDSEYDESQIADLYEQSGRHLTYLGDWHTHPAPLHHLSRRDKRTLRRIARCHSARVKTPIMLVLVLDRSWHPTLWRGTLCRSILWRKNLSVVQLKVRAF